MLTTPFYEPKPSIEEQLREAQELKDTSRVDLYEALVEVAKKHYTTTAERMAAVTAMQDLAIREASLRVRRNLRDEADRRQALRDKIEERISH